MNDNYPQQHPAAWRDQVGVTTPRLAVASGWASTSEREVGIGQRCHAELLHSLVEQQAEERPSAIALCDGRVSWSYGEVERRANQLARLLRARGIRPGRLVGVYLPRSAEAIIALLGILKAGGAYVPIDPDYPREWLATIVADSAVDLLVTTRELSSRPLCDAVQAVCVDAMEKGELKSSFNRFDSGVRPTDPAYVIYTSGSTGESKGVVVEHRNVLYSTRCRLGYYSQPVERFALIPSLAFDASVATIFWTLCKGGTLCLPPVGLERDPVRLSRWIAAERISHWLSVPALYQLLLEQPSETLRSLRVVVLGGESCPPALVRTHHRALPHAELYNEYGPTEATVWSSVHACRPENPGELVPIGRPLPGTRLVVLDKTGQPVTAGRPGELYIGGPGVARSYLRSPELTSEKFVRDIFSVGEDQRLYRTGDRVKQLHDGSFMFLGRLDQQTKVRGHRVEPGQIEATLGMLDGVAQAVVVTQRRGDRDQLVAFVVPHTGAQLSARGVRQALEMRLPSYMVPSHIALRDRLPLTARGKIDRRELQSARLESPGASYEVILPVDETESRLVSCWEGVFGQRPIGPCDNFFELGGDSLLAAALFAKVEVEFGRSLPPETLLECPTVRLLAALLQAPSTTRVPSSAVRIYASLHQPPVFCLPGIGGHVLEFRELAGQLRGRHAVYGLCPAGLEDGAEPHRSIEAMAAYAIQQMRQVQPHGPYALVGYSLGGVVAFEMARQLNDAGQKIGLLALLDSRLWSPSKPLALWQRVGLHRHNLIHSAGRGRWNYICERGRVLAARLRQLRFRPSEDDVILGLKLSAASRRVARQHWRAWRDYRPGKYDGELLLFVARRQPGMSEEDGSDPTLGWSQRTSGGVDTTLMTATHAEMLRAENSKVLALAIESHLARIATLHSPPTSP